MTKDLSTSDADHTASIKHVLVHGLMMAEQHLYSSMTVFLRAWHDGVLVKDNQFDGSSRFHSAAVFPTCRGGRLAGTCTCMEP
jgi:hypothetical protein